MNPASLLAELTELHPGAHRGVGPVHAGLEARTGGGYHWDGLKRGIDPAHPVAILQYTLAGWGMYDDPSTSQRVGPGRLFVAIVPGPHRYYLPPQAPAWTFFYLLIRHDYIVARLAETQRQCGAVVDVPADAPLVGRMVAAWRDAVGGRFPDEPAAELAAFSVMVEYQRFAISRLHPEAPRQRLLDEVRAVVHANLQRGIGIEDLARRHGMTRSHFSHYFKATTGLSPARFITQTRLEASIRLLRQGDEKLQVIARRCGFADANHFCKVFRRHHHITPGEFRRQMR